MVWCILMWYRNLITAAYTAKPVREGNCWDSGRQWVIITRRNASDQWLSFPWRWKSLRTVVLETASRSSAMYHSICLIQTVPVWLGDSYAENALHDRRKTAETVAKKRVSLRMSKASNMVDKKKQSTKGDIPGKARSLKAGLVSSKNDSDFSRFLNEEQNHLSSLGDADVKLKSSMAKLKYKAWRTSQSREVWLESEFRRLIFWLINRVQIVEPFLFKF